MEELKLGRVHLIEVTEDYEFVAGAGAPNHVSLKILQPGMQGNAAAELTGIGFMLMGAELYILPEWLGALRQMVEFAEQKVQEFEEKR